MSEFTLTAKPVLIEFNQDKSAKIGEVTGKALVSIAIPLDGKGRLQKSITKAWGLNIPVPGTSADNRNALVRLIGLQQDQLLAVLDYDGDRAVQEVASKLGDCGYYTDQSDSWVMIRLSGSLSRRALERICPINLHPDVFKVGHVARTSMEHVGTIILREDKDSYILMGMRSFGASLLHAVETSVRYIL